MDRGERRPRPGPPTARRRLVECLRRFHPQLPVHTAYQQNPNLRAVGTRVLQARAQQAIAAGNLFPQTQEATGSYSRVALSHNAFNNPAAFSALAAHPDPARLPHRQLLPRLDRRLQPELGTGLLGPLPPGHRVRQRQPRRFGRKLRRRPGDAPGRRGDELRAVPGGPAADQDRARQHPEARGGRGHGRAASESRHLGPVRRGTAADASGTDALDHPGPADRAGSGERHALYPAGRPAARPGAGVRRGAGVGQRADAEHADLGRGGHPGRLAAPPPRRPQRRAPGGGPERPDRRRRSGPVSHHLHQRHAGLGGPGAFPSCSSPTASSGPSRRTSGGTS